MTALQDALDRDLRTLVLGRSVEPSRRWVRVKFGGEFIADTKRPLFLRQYGPGRFPTYCFPEADVRAEVRAPGALVPDADGVARWTVRVGDRVAENAAWTYVEPPGSLAALRGYVGFDWDAMDAWYEEEEAVFVHARDLRTRVAALPSSRHVRVRPWPRRGAPPSCSRPTSRRATTSRARTCAWSCWSRPA